jgi:hypothetical protein
VVKEHQRQTLNHADTELDSKRQVFIDICVLEMKSSKEQCKSLKFKNVFPFCIFFGEKRTYVSRNPRGSITKP